MEVSAILSILLLVLVLCIVVWGARTLMSAWSVGEPLATTIYVVLVVLFAVAILMRLGGLGGLVVR